MIHTIKNKQGKYLQGKEYDECKYMIDRGLDSIKINDCIVSVVSDYRKDGEHISVVDYECENG